MTKENEVIVVRCSCGQEFCVYSPVGNAGRTFCFKAPKTTAIRREPKTTRLVEGS